MRVAVCVWGWEKAPRHKTTHTTRKKKSQNLVVFLQTLANAKATEWRVHQGSKSSRVECRRTAGASPFISESSSVSRWRNTTQSEQLPLPFGADLMQSRAFGGNKQQQLRQSTTPRLEQLVLSTREASQRRSGMPVKYKLSMPPLGRGQHALASATLVHTPALRHHTLIPLHRSTHPFHRTLLLARCTAASPQVASFRAHPTPGCLLVVDSGVSSSVTNQSRSSTPTTCHHQQHTLAIMSSYENLSPQVITRVAREIQDLVRKPTPGKPYV